MKKSTEKTAASIITGQDWLDIRDAIYRAMLAIDQFYENLKAEGKQPQTQVELKLCDRLQRIHEDKIPVIIDEFFPVEEVNKAENKKK